MAGIFPPGFKFIPDDATLIKDCLGNKILNEPIQYYNFIPSRNLLDYTPDEIAEAQQPLAEETWFFFTVKEHKKSESKTEKSSKKDRSRRVRMNVGVWNKNSGNSIDFEGKLIGYKHNFKFHWLEKSVADPTKFKRIDPSTHWVLDEFTYLLDEKEQDLRICRIHVSRTSDQKKQERLKQEGMKQKNKRPRKLKESCKKIPDPRSGRRRLEDDHKQQ